MKRLYVREDGSLTVAAGSVDATGQLVPHESLWRAAMTRDDYRTTYTRFRSGRLLAVVEFADGDCDAACDRPGQFGEAASWLECDT